MYIKISVWKEIFVMIPVFQTSQFEQINTLQFELFLTPVMFLEYLLACKHDITPLLQAGIKLVTLN